MTVTGFSIENLMGSMVFVSGCWLLVPGRWFLAAGLRHLLRVARCGLRGENQTNPQSNSFASYNLISVFCHLSSVFWLLKRHRLSISQAFIAIDDDQHTFLKSG